MEVFMANDEKVDKQGGEGCACFLWLLWEDKAGDYAAVTSSRTS